MKNSYTQDELEEILINIPERKGWTFSYMKVKSLPVPWDYLEIVKKYIKREDTVLDIGTGGGERFKQLAEYFNEGIGTDVDDKMIDIASKDCPQNVSFIKDDEKLARTNKSFDLIINRHAPYDLNAIAKHLKPNGYFITQQVGENNMYNILSTLGKRRKDAVISREMFTNTGLEVIAFMEYDIDYRVLDIESLLFWLNALDYLHTGFDSTPAAKDAELLNKILKSGLDGDTYLTNEHRFLVVARKSK